MRIEAIQYILDELGGGNYKMSGGHHLMSICPLSEWTHGSGREKAPSFGVLIRDGSPTPCNCFNSDCDATGTLWDLINKVGRRKIAAKEAGWNQERLGDLLLYCIDAEEELLGDEARIELPKLPIPQDLLDSLGKGSDYWSGRGVDARTMQDWRLFELGNRAWIPIIDQQGEVVAVQGRLLPGEDADDLRYDEESGRLPQPNKYRTEPARFEKGEYLVGEHLLYGGRTVDMLIIVEGIADAPLLNAWLKEWWEAGRYEIFPYGADTRGFLAVSTMGDKVTKVQVQKMVNFLSERGELVIGFDKDEGGITGARRLVGGEDGGKFDSHDLWMRVPTLTEVTWKRKDPSDQGDPKVEMDEVKDDAAEAIASRVNWLEKRLSRSLTMKG